jgi:ketosteroid isomerase-like protein
MDTATRPTPGRQVIEGFLEATERRDYDAMRGYVHPDVEMTWPQSGERFKGVDAALGALLATEEKPEIAGEPMIMGEGDTWVITMPLRYGADTYHYAGVFELEDGRVRRTTEFFGAPFPPNPARAQFALPAGG